MEKKNEKKTLVNEVVDVNGSKVYIENGEVKTILSEEIQKSGYMTVDEMYHLIDNKIKMLYKVEDDL